MVAALGGPLLAFQLIGPLHQRGSPFNTGYYAVDLANYVVPSELVALSTPSTRGWAGHFPGGPEEHTGYLGLPLLLLAGVAWVLGRGRPAIRVPLLLGAATAVLALGPRLTLLGERTSLPLPWAVLHPLPGFDNVIPTRFALFTALLLGTGLAFALDELLRRPRWRTRALVVAAAALIPVIPAALPGRPAPTVPAFFTGPAVAATACPGGSLLVLPFPRYETTAPMLWQQAAGYSFAMPGGYFIGPGPNRHAYVYGTPTATGQLLADVARDGRPRPVTSQILAAFAADLTSWRTCAAVLGPGPNHDALRTQLTELFGSDPEPIDGVDLWRVQPPAR